MKNEIITAPTSEALDLLKQSFPAEQGFDRILLPRLGFVTQDKTEGKGKSMTVIAEAGTFYTEVETDEKTAEGKKKWAKTDIGETLEATVIYSRKQLKFYDNATEAFTSSPIYDEGTEIIPLFCSGTKMFEGTPAELKKKYEFKDEDGKTKSKLEENKILYVLYNGEVYQLNLRGSSMYSWKTFARKTTLIPAQLTKFNSEACEKGQISWNKMTFEKVRDLDAQEIDDVQERVTSIRNAIGAEKAYYKRDKELAATPIPYPVEVAGGEDIPF